jgi:hypothetical protein
MGDQVHKGTSNVERAVSFGWRALRVQDTNAPSAGVGRRSRDYSSWGRRLNGQIHS